MMIPILKGVGGATGIFAALALDEKTGINIGLTITIIIAVWWLGRELQSLRDTGKTLTESQNKTNLKIEALDVKLAGVEKKVDTALASRRR